jgi:hypothetical protein
LLLYAAGFAVGAMYSNFINDASFSETSESLRVFIENLAAGGNSLRFQDLFAADFTPSAEAFFMGFFLIGIPATLFFVFKAGFSLGFFVTFLIKAFSMKGFFMGMYFLFYNLILFLPILSVIAVNSININRYIIGCVSKKYTMQRNFGPTAAAYIIVFAVCALIAVLSVNLKIVLLPRIARYLFG